MLNVNIMFQKGLQKLVSFLILSFFILLPSLMLSQSIINVTTDTSSEPYSFQIYGGMFPGYISIIETEASEVEDDLMIIRMYFKHCSANSILHYYDTLVTVQATFPYDLLILTYRDSNTVVAGGPVPCYLTHNTIQPIDTFHLSAAQILSTREPGRAPSMQVYPNPVADRLYFKAGTPWYNALVYSSSGGRVIEVQRAAQEDEIPVAYLPSGMYMMVLYGSDGEVVGKARFVKSP